MSVWAPSAKEVKALSLDDKSAVECQKPPVGAMCQWAFFLPASLIAGMSSHGTYRSAFDE